MSARLLHRLSGQWPLLFGGIVLLQVLVLAQWGQPWICACGSVDLWHGNHAGPETSQHLTDWYSFSHVIHGFAFYALLWWLAPGMPMGLRFACAIGIEVAWELVENTPLVMERYRQSALAQGYFGDSIVNSVADTLAAALGFLLARALPVWVSLALVAGAELFVGFMIRDNLTLNIVQLLYPNEALSAWQTGG